MAKAHISIKLLFAAFMLALFTPAPLQATDAPVTFADLVEKLSPAVVNISTSQKVKNAQIFGLPFQDLPNTPEMEPFREFFEHFNQQRGGKQQVEREVYSLGSGFVIDASGYIITNNHVIDDADEITVTLSDNSKLKAKIIGRDKKTDLALLKVESKKPLVAATMGDSEAMRVGDWVMAIGNPFGLGGSVTKGIISARQRSINAGPFDDFLQIDAPINRGNSGGPLFNMKGEVIGINTAIFSPSGGSVGIGFAIPTSLAKPVIEQLKTYGRTHRGWLGVKIQEVSEEIADSVGLAKPMGALVLEVTKGSPADKAGVQAGDVITSFDGREVTEMRFLPRMVAETKSGKQVPVSVWRKGAAKTLTLTVAEMEETDEQDGKAGKDKKSGQKKSAPEEMFLGMSITPVSPAVRQELGLSDQQDGLLVVEVKSGSAAAKYAIRAGDVLVDVNNEPVASVEGLKKAFEKARAAGRKFALVKVMRGKESAFITLPTSEEKKPDNEEEAPEALEKQ
jgi:serine protease Do